MRVLVACEESQAVCKEFRKLGHEAYSADILDCSGGHPEWHIKGDVLKILNDNWDLLIAHPVCKYLTNSGVCHLHTDESRWYKLQEAAEFFNAFLDCNIEKKCIENPIMHEYARALIRSGYTQLIQPWMFGHMEQKATCLWLENLPPLKTTNIVYDEMMKLPDKERQRLHYLSPGPNREKERSKTFRGIAEAMAGQWGNLDESEYYYKFRQANLL